MPLLFFAMEEDHTGLTDSGKMNLSASGNLSASKKKKKIRPSNPTRTRNIPMTDLAEKPADVAIPIEGLDEIDGPADATAKKNEPVESANEKKERERREEEQPFLPFKKDAKTIVAFMWSLPRFQEAAKESLTEVDLVEYMKVASAYSEEDEGKSFQAFMASIASDQTGADEKIGLGASWLARMVRYRHHKSAAHKEKARVFSQQKTAANQRTVGTAIIGGAVTLTSLLLQHYFPSGCSSVATVAPVVANRTISMLSNFL